LAILAILVITGPLLAAGACDGNSPPGDHEAQAPDLEDGTKEVRGRVIQVEAESITALASLTIRDESGKEWTFRGEGYVGVTPSHLRQHQVIAQPITVLYRETDDGLLAVWVTD
jgi:hypothetical protein